MFQRKVVGSMFLRFPPVASGWRPFTVSSCLPRSHPFCPGSSRGYLPCVAGFWALQLIFSTPPSLVFLAMRTGRDLPFFWAGRLPLILSCSFRAGSRVICHFPPLIHLVVLGVGLAVPVQVCIIALSLLHPPVVVACGVCVSHWPSLALFAVAGSPSGRVGLTRLHGGPAPLWNLRWHFSCGCVVSSPLSLPNRSILLSDRSSPSFPSISACLG